MGAGIQRPLSWHSDDIALQNIQARVRAPSVWLLANVKGALLLAIEESTGVWVDESLLTEKTLASAETLAACVHDQLPDR